MPKNLLINCYFKCVSPEHLHRLPVVKNQDDERFKQWQKVLSKETIQRGPKYIYNNIKLCEKHFEEKYVLLKFPYLTRNAVPTLNLYDWSEETTTVISEELPPAESIDYVDGADQSTLEEPFYEFDANNDVSFTTLGVPIQPVSTIYAINDSPEVPIELDEAMPARPRTESVDSNQSTLDDGRSHKETPTNPILLRIPMNDRIPDEKLAESPPTDPSKEQWKYKLKLILHSTKFCGICLNSDDNMNTVNNEVKVVGGERKYSETIIHMLDVVLKETDNILASSQLCTKCTNELIQSYTFIRQARETSKILNCHVTDLSNKACYIRNSILQNTDKNRKKPEIRNVLIASENYDIPNNFSNHIYTINLKNKSDYKKLKQKSKCLKCNLFLPSYKAWRIHELSVHGNSKKLKMLPVSKNGQKWRKICKICCRLIRNNGILKHMKKYHRLSQVACSKCNITFDTFNDLESHIHYKEDSRCSTCW